MKAEQLYTHLKQLAERMDITVAEYSFRDSRLPVRSGACKIKGKQFFIMDRNLSIHMKNRILGSWLATLAIENIYIVPKVRQYLERYGQSNARHHD